MNFSRIVFSCILLVGPGVAFGQGLDPAALLKQPADMWPTYNGDYSGRRFSPLTQINSSNVQALIACLVRPFHRAIERRHSD